MQGRLQPKQRPSVQSGFLVPVLFLPLWAPISPAVLPEIPLLSSLLFSASNIHFKTFYSTVLFIARGLLSNGSPNITRKQKPKFTFLIILLPLGELGFLPMSMLKGWLSRLLPIIQETNKSACWRYSRRMLFHVFLKVLGHVRATIRHRLYTSSMKSPSHTGILLKKEILTINRTLNPTIFKGHDLLFYSIFTAINVILHCSKAENKFPHQIIFRCPKQG